MRNFLRSFKTTLVGSLCGGGILGTSVFAWANGGKFSTHDVIGGIAIMALGILAKDADKVGAAPTN